jgi:glucokinase
MSSDHAALEVPVSFEHLPLVVGIDLGGTQIRTAVMRGPHLLSRVGMLTNEQPGSENVISRMIQSVHQAIDEAGVSQEQITGIGIGAPGPLNGKTGIVFCPPNLPGWQNTPLRDIFYEHFQCPIYLENDANVAAMGEYMFGAGQGSRNIAYLTISTGIGGGIIANGQLLTGTIGTGAELGHMTINLQGPRCNCGNIGCLESLASGTAIARRANELIALGKTGSEDLVNFALSKQIHETGANTPYASQSFSTKVVHVDTLMVAQAAASGVPLAREIITSAAEALGVGLVNIIHMFNPEVIILGGGVTQIGEPLLGPARRIVEERAMRVSRESVRIVMAALGGDAGLIGAGSLVYYHKEKQTV